MQKVLDPSYHDSVLTPYLKQTLNPDATLKQEISLKTHLPYLIIDDWFYNQRKEISDEKSSETKNKNRVLKVEPLLLKSLNESGFFTEKNVLELMIETGLEFSEIHDWYRGLKLEISKFYEKFPNPSNTILKAKSSELGVAIGVLKDWLRPKPIVNALVFENKIREALKVEIEKGDLLCKNENHKYMFEENKSLKDFYLINQVPSRQEKLRLAEALNCSYSKIDEWFLKIKILKRLLHEINENLSSEAVVKQEPKPNNDTKRKLKRGKLTAKEEEFLENYFFENESPTKEKIFRIANKLNRECKLVNQWFVKTRKKYDIPERQKSAYLPSHDFERRFFDVPTRVKTPANLEMTFLSNNGNNASAQKEYLHVGKFSALHRPQFHSNLKMSVSSDEDHDENRSSDEEMNYQDWLKRQPKYKHLH